jgi:hypothetical protein
MDRDVSMREFLCEADLKYRKRYMYERTVKPLVYSTMGTEK